MADYRKLILLVFLLLSPAVCEAKKKKFCWKQVGGAVVGGAAAVGGAALALPAMGFTSAGIAAGSLAAKVMSLSWATGWGAGVVGGLQSAGVVGIGATAKAAFAGLGAYLIDCGEEEEEGEAEKEEKRD